ncbi:MAG: hypothetical protein Q9202_004758 [Teloschistes flavicans]
MAIGGLVELASADLPSVVESAAAEDDDALEVLRATEDDDAGVELAAAEDDNAGVELAAAKDDDAGVELAAAKDDDAGVELAAAEDDDAGVELAAAKDSNVVKVVRATEDDNAGVELAAVEDDDALEVVRATGIIGAGVEASVELRAVADGGLAIFDLERSFILCAIAGAPSDVRFAAPTPVSARAHVPEVVTDRIIYGSMSAVPPRWRSWIRTQAELATCGGIPLGILASPPSHRA